MTKYLIVRVKRNLTNNCDGCHKVWFKKGDIVYREKDVHITKETLNFCINCAKQRYLDLKNEEEKSKLYQTKKRLEQNIKRIENDWCFK